jgi:hypothetical protein
VTGTGAEQGPLQELTGELNRLHTDAGRPSLQRMSAAIEKIEDRTDQVSHDTISAMLKGTRVPKWEKLRYVVAVLAEQSVRRPDLHEEQQRFHSLWERADRAATGDEEAATSESEAARRWDPKATAREDFQQLVGSLFQGDSSAVLAMALFAAAPHETAAAAFLHRPEALAPLLMNMEWKARSELLRRFTDEELAYLVAEQLDPVQAGQLLVALRWGVNYMNDSGYRDLKPLVAPMGPDRFGRIIDTLDPLPAAEVLEEAQYPHLAEVLDQMDVLRLAKLTNAVGKVDHHGWDVRQAMRAAAERHGLEFR